MDLVVNPRIWMWFMIIFIFSEWEKEDDMCECATHTCYIVDTYVFLLYACHIVTIMLLKLN